MAQQMHVSQDQRSTVSSKKRQIMLLDEAVYMVKIDFNKRFLALREVKRRVCQQIGDIQSPLKETLTALGKPTTNLTNPRLLPDEEPELRDQVSINILLGVCIAYNHTLQQIDRVHAAQCTAHAQLCN